MSEQIRQMFARLAPRYDLGNAYLALGQIPRWHRAAVRHSGVRVGGNVLDCATGTGDLALAFARWVGPTGQVTALDFCAEMLARLPAKAQWAGLSNISTVEADMLALPFADHSFDCAACSFGIRNVDDPVRGLAEMARVVRPGGSVVVLETGQPVNPLLQRLYAVYNRLYMPGIGTLLTGNKAAYAYLQRTSSAFPSGPDFVAIMREAHPFRLVKATPLLGGVAWLYAAAV
jgi:demethylmenaquinone methyltransferase/2-methoxy-6-polyprenyl-1,4-benzoquinol methylase